MAVTRSEQREKAEEAFKEIVQEYWEGSKDDLEALGKYIAAKAVIEAQTGGLSEETKAQIKLMEGFAKVKAKAFAYDALNVGLKVLMAIL